jgi:hypothetical protein
LAIVFWYEINNLRKKRKKTMPKWFIFLDFFVSSIVFIFFCTD